MKIENKVEDIVESFEKMCKAKNLLGMDGGDTDKLDNLKEEMDGLKILWEELAKVWEHISGMSETLLAYANPLKIKKAVHDAHEMLNSFSRRLRFYEAFEVM